MKVVRLSGRSKKLVSRIVSSFSGEYCETYRTIVGNGVKFPIPYVHPDTQMRSNQGIDWEQVTHYAMTHLYMREYMKIFGTIGVNEVSNELKQPHLNNKF